MTYLTSQDKRRIKRLEKLTAEAVDALKEEFYYRRMPPLPEVTCYMAGMRMKENPKFRQRLSRSRGMNKADRVYYNLDLLAPENLEERLLLVGEEVGHYLHTRINPRLDEHEGDAYKRHQRALWREAYNISEFVGFWAGCLFAQSRGGYDPQERLKHSMPWMHQDEEHYWGIYAAAHLLRERTPLRLRDFVRLCSWKSVKKRYMPYLDFTPDFTQWPPREAVLNR